MRSTSAEGIVSLRRLRIPAIILVSFVFFLDLIVSYMRAFRLLGATFNVFF
jgi:hypothetical protein